jgi:hypothetical protein
VAFGRPLPVLARARKFKSRAARGPNFRKNRSSSIFVVEKM